MIDRKQTLVGGVAAALLLSTGLLQAALTVQGNATVYDSVQDISWDQDGNAVKTLCDANDPIWQAFNPVVVGSSSRTKTQICDQDGILNWFEAQAWVAHLNAEGYKGITNWRQWAVTQPDPTCSEQSGDTPPQGSGNGCTGSEMGHLFRIPPPGGLGNPNQDDLCTPNCLQHTVPFVNFRESAYWSGTEVETFPPNAWGFDASSGRQGQDGKFGGQLYIWAVRPGQVGPAPGQAQPVPALGAWSLGLLGLMLVGVARARLR